MPGKIARSEQVLREAILDVLRSQPADAIGGRLARALIESREPDEHPEDRCQNCRERFFPWTATPEQWEHVTGRDHGGPIICRPCFDRRVRRLAIVPSGHA